MAVFGDDLYGLRTASAFLGVASILFTFLLARRLFGERVATVASFLFLLAGCGAGLCWIVYFGARLSPLIAALYVCHRVLREPGLGKRIVPGLAVTAAGAAVFSPLSV